jgi:O-antigen/teichoic acid export membrane protein
VTSVGRAAARGVRWAALSLALRQALLLGALILITRLIGPERYGLAMMALAVASFVDLFKDLGTGAAIVQRRDCDDDLLASTFWLNVVFSAFCAAAVALAAPLAAAFFREQEVTGLLRGLSLGFVLASLSIVPLALFQRALAFRILAMIEILAALAGAAAGVGVALAGFGVWSIVAQSLATAAVTTAVAWAASPWRPLLRVSRAGLAPFREFGAALAGFNAANYFIRNADYLLVGRYLGALSLGVYTLAYRLILFPQQNLAVVVNRVLFPVLARVEAPDEFRRTYLQLARLLALLATPVYVGIFTLREPLVRACFGEEWLAAAPVLALLAPVGLFQILSGSTGLIYQARGRTDLLLRWGLAAGFVTVVSFAIGLRWGLPGVAAAYLGSTFGLAYPVFAIPFRLIDLPVATFAREMLPALGCGAGMLATISALSPLAVGMPPVAALASLGAAGGAVYLALSWLLNPGALAELRRGIAF